MKKWRLNGNSMEWANENYLNYKSLKKVNDVRKQIILIMLNNNIKLVSCKNNWEEIRKCIIAGYFLNACKIKRYWIICKFKNRTTMCFTSF